MGRPFSTELAAIERTLRWAKAQDVSVLKQFVSDVASRTLIAIGSGGSSTACHLTALLHRYRFQRPALFTTPLDVLFVPAGLHRAGVFLASASGMNRDALAALEACILEEVPSLATITMRSTSPLSEAAAKYARSHVFAADAPTGKDGYLATNSLLATCVLVARAYGFDVSTRGMKSQALRVPALQDRQMVQILHGGWSAPVATDLESKLNESALAAAQLADYRNFGHGRHLWLGRRAADTTLVALVTPETASIAAATLKFVPKDVPVVRLETDLEGPDGTIALLLQAFDFVGRLGEARGQDPGRPHVAEFGRRLYRIAPPRLRPVLEAPIQRKVWASPGEANDIEIFRKGLATFLSEARRAKIGALALDYDGTLCSKNDRFNGLRRDIVAECARLLTAGIPLGLATGRGKSVREELQRVLDPSLWPLVTVGYYNATDIGALGDDLLPEKFMPTDVILKRALLLLSEDEWLSEKATISPRPLQLTVEPKESIGTEAFAAHVMGRLAPLEGQGVRILVSSHSLDVLGSERGKGSLVSHLREKVGEGREVLCIGDRGAWPGNDYSLLAEHLSLSVDEVSSLSDSCWNLAPRGVSGPDATLLYLAALRVVDGVGKFRWKMAASR